MELFDKIHALESEKSQLEVEMHDQATSISDMKHDIKHSPFSIDQIKHSPSLMKLNTEKFEWIFKHIEVNLPNLKYYRGEHSTIEKKYHTDELMKPGPKRKLSHRDEMLLTLMKLRLDLLEDDMAFRFNISTSLVSQILSTWIPLLGKELSGLIYWPTREEVKQNYPKCFLKWPNVRTIIDCTEIPLQRPSMAKANTQIYSTYKGRPTAKALIGCTPGGTVSYISKAAGGAMSDKKLVKMSGIVNQFEPYDTCMADRGFNIQDILSPFMVKLVIPPFLKKKDQQLSTADNIRTKTVANARIHIERVIGRMKEFKILRNELSLDMLPLLDNILKNYGRYLLA